MKLVQLDRMASFDELLGNLELALGIEPRTWAQIDIDAPRRLYSPGTFTIEI